AAAVAGVALAGCVSNEAEVSPKAEGRIAFAAPLVSGVTRAYVGEIKNPYPTEENFMVSAKYYDNAFDSWNNGQSYMSGVKVVYSAADNAWAPEGQDYYWPKNGSLTFFAYSPADYSSWAPAINADEKLAASAVAVTAANVDLLYSDLTKDQTKANYTTNTYYNGVDIKFCHALSSIVFKTRLTSELNGTTITVNEVTLSGVSSKGDFEWSLDADDAPVWSSQSEAAGYTAVSGAGQEVKYGDAVELEGANALILLPQSLTDAVATVKYTIQNDGGEAIEQTTTVALADLKYGSQESAEWLPGKRYIYTVNFGLDRIVFAPQVKDWEDVVVSE
ncbi:MAG: fimbrillin family protein, partial [Alistipes sp.]|nr:fimbrillin family protein [Alistipes sp.]